MTFKQYFFKLRLLILVSLVTSCASATQGQYQKIHVSSKPKNAVAITSHGFGCDLTPCTIVVPRNQKFTLKVTKPGYTTKSIRITPQVSGAGVAQGVGSLAFLGIGGIGYDLYNGAMLELSPNKINVKLENMSAMLLEEVRAVSTIDIFID